ncbi:MAG: GNAT family N-acetyltransferase [Hyphomicrobiales bacterium]|nr:GNAT family N-acetyltransferase [Hyphomicrobiales bacterium]
MTFGQPPPIVLLASHHNRQSFFSGNDALDSYLKRQAGQDIKRRVCRVFVMTATDAPDAVLGFYTLSSSEIKLTELPEAQARKLPRHPVPAVLLGRLAVSRDFQGSGLGGQLLADAIERTSAISSEIGIYALVVDAIDESAKAFYEHFGFNVLMQGGTRLFFPLKSIS